MSKGKKDAEFIHQLQKIEKEYNQILQNMTYKVKPGIIATSKLIDIKKIAEPIEQYSSSLVVDFGQMNLNKSEEN